MCVSGGEEVLRWELFPCKFMFTQGDSGLPCSPFAFNLSQHQGVGDTIQLSHLLSSPFPPAFSLSQHQGLFQ